MSTSGVLDCVAKNVREDRDISSRKYDCFTELVGLAKQLSEKHKLNLEELVSIAEAFGNTVRDAGAAALPAVSPDASGSARASASADAPAAALADGSGDKNAKDACETSAPAPIAGAPTDTPANTPVATDNSDETDATSSRAVVSPEQFEEEYAKFEKSIKFEINIYSQQSDSRGSIPARHAGKKRQRAVPIVDDRSPKK